MQAIVITDEQAVNLLAANGDSPLTLQPRRLADGRLILNADILDDPYFSDPSKPWAQALGLTVAEIPDNEAAVDATKPGTLETGVITTDPGADIPVSSSQPSTLLIVELTAAELAEPA